MYLAENELPLEIQDSKTIQLQIIFLDILYRLNFNLLWRPDPY